MHLKPPVRYVRTPIVAVDEKTGEPTVTRKLGVVHEKLSAVSVEGEQFKMKDGLVEVPDRLGARLMAEGWEQVAPPEGWTPPAASQSSQGAGAGSSGAGAGSSSGSGSGGSASGNRGSGNRGGANA